MLFLLFIQNFPFNKQFNGVFKNTYNPADVSAVASSSIECYFSSLGKDILTNPVSVIDPEDNLEWCSKVNESKNDYPWIEVIFHNKKLSMTGYSVKSGCCYANDCCCMIYSWSLLGSNDNKTWTKLHSVAKNKELRRCRNESFSFNEKGSFSMFKFIQDEPEPECWYCLNLNRLEFYGTLNEGAGEEIANEDEVSIIGRVKKE